MATAVVVPTITKRYKVGRTIHLYGTLAIDASPDTYLTGGLVLDLSGKAPGCRKPPLFLYAHGISGYWYEWAVGTTIANGKLKARVATSVGAGDLPQTEFGNGTAISAALSGDTVTFWAQFDALN